MAAKRISFFTRLTAVTRLSIHLHFNRFRPYHHVSIRPFSALPSPLLDPDVTPPVLSPLSPEEPRPQTTVLRPYQHTAVEACLSALTSGLTRIGVSSPTGSGKTTMFMSLIPKISPQTSVGVDGRGRTLIIVGSVELANQAESAAKRLLGEEWTVEVEQSKRVASGMANVTIATYQTLNSIERLKKFDPKKFKLIIVDEAHHAAAISYLRILHYFNEDVQLPSTISPITSQSHGSKVPIIGFSATFSRHDQLALRAVFENIVFHTEISSMLQDGWLSPVKSTTIQCDLHLDTVKLTSTGDYRTDSLALHINTPEISRLIVGTYLRRAKERRSTLIFCVDLSHVDNLTQAFRNAGVDARSVSSATQASRRKETVASFGRGEFPVLVNCEVLTEGADIPQIDCIILARPTKSKNLLAQMVGRGLRLSPETGKEDCHIIDIVDSMSRTNGMIVSPTLWGLSHDDITRDELRSPSQDEPGFTAPGDEEEERTQLQPRKVTFIDNEDPFGLSSRSYIPVKRMSTNAWVYCGKDKYALELMGNHGWISIERQEDEDTWCITYRRKLSRYSKSRIPFARPIIVAYADDLERAMKSADAFAEKKLGRELSSHLSRYAPWRQRPATEKQLKMLLSMAGVSSSSSETEIEEQSGDDRKAKIDSLPGEIWLWNRRVSVDQLTAGEIAAYLCAAQHGGIAGRKKADKEEAALKKKAMKRREAEARNLPLSEKGL
ncbi:hypothetical protein M231_05294 [Tremella mesenterica]|uniref:DEAD box family helicase n=1 Tax=Tremella mesenterica TaxID=5217 RepID=A0A4Q1BII7_TREME|nr:hypothetical protein M231_05294 [Tremella mesenterica]